MSSLDPTEVSRDRSIPGLADALDPRQAARWLEPHLAGIAGPGGRVRLVAARPVRHKPGRRCLIEYELDVRPAGRASRRVVVLGKTRARGVDQRTARLVEVLWAGGFSATSEDEISVPEPLGVVPELGIWLQRKVPGVPATRLLSGPEGPALARRIGAALHKLHSSGIPARRSHRMDDELRILGERLSALGREEPRWARRFVTLLEDCRRLGSCATEGPSTGIHRDFYPDQIVVGDDGRLFLLDLDLYSEGDPALDAGNFLGHVIEQAVRVGGGAESSGPVEEAFREGWLELAGERRRWSVEVHTLLSLARQISLSAGFSERRAWTEPILELTERRAAWLGSFERRREAGAAS